MLGKEIKWTKSFKQTSSNSDEYWEDLKLQITENKINKPNSLYSFKSKWYENWVFEKIGGFTSVIFRITEQCETLNNWLFFENTGGAKSLKNFKFYKILSTQYFIYLHQRVQEKSQYVIYLIKNITHRCVTLPASRQVFLKYKRGSFPVKTIFRTLKGALSKRKKGFLLFTHQEAVRILRQMRKKHTRLSVIGIKYDRLSIHAHFSCLLLRRNKLVRI